MGRRSSVHNSKENNSGIPHTRLVKHKDHKDNNSFFKPGEQHEQKIGHPKGDERPFIKQSSGPARMMTYAISNDDIFISGQSQVIPVSFGKFREAPRNSRQLVLETDGGFRVDDDKEVVKVSVGKPKKIGT